MIIPSSLIKLDYNPSGDVLSVEWPDVHNYSKSEVVFVLENIVEAVRLYDVKHLLADTRKGVVEMEDEEYKKIILDFANNLKQTRLRKLARVVNAETLRAKQINEVREKAQLAILVENFESTEEALQWFQEE